MKLSIVFQILIAMALVFQTCVAIFWSKKVKKSYKMSRRFYSFQLLFKGTGK